MPLCTAVLAAALLSGPAGAPGDQAPLSAREPMSPGKQIAALAMNHPEEPDFVAAKTLDILDKGAKVGPFMSADDQAENRANGPAANGRPANRPATGTQANGGAGAAAPRGDGPTGAGPNVPLISRPGDQANGSQPANGSMFTMPATGKNTANGGGAPQDVFLHPTSNQPTYTKLSGNDFTRKPTTRQTDDEDAGAWVREMQGWGMQKPGKAKAAKPQAKPQAKPKAQSKAPISDDFWNMPGWD
ncbi:hypothetical protein ACWEQG_04865 [Microbispora sp. NPDC004025]